MTFKFKHILVIIFILTIFITNRYFFNFSYFPVHDSTVLSRIIEQHKTIKSGQFPPRWSANFGFAYGMPIFQFYAPLAYYFAEIFVLFGFNPLNSLKATYITINIFAFLGAYYLGKKLTNSWGGLLSAISFSFFTYRAVNIFVRGSLAELLAISLFPWIILLIINLINQSNKKNYLFLTIILSLFFLSHNISILTFLPFCFLIIFYFIIQNYTFEKIKLLVFSFMNAFLIASFFLLPAFTQQKYTRVNSLTQEFSNYQHHFLSLKQLFIRNWGYGGSILGPQDDLSFYLGNETLLLIFVTFVYFFIYKNKIKSEKRTKKDFLFFIFLFLLSVFLTSYKSAFIWNNLPLISFIQFPWRFLGISTFILSILLSYLSLIPIKNRQLLLAPIAFIILLNFNYFRPDKLTQNQNIVNPSVQFIKEELSSVIPDYLPPDIDWQALEPIDFPFNYQKEKVNINLIKNNSQEITAHLNAKEESNISINRFVFPNWQSKLNNQELNCEIKDFIYQCPIPAGDHLFQFYWSEKGINQFANYMSIFGLILLLVVCRSSKLPS